MVKKVRAAKQSGVATCAVCRTTFHFESRKIPSTCGDLYCAAVDTWDQERWEGAARMAHIRQSLDLPITQLDLDAIMRTEETKSV